MSELLLLPIVFNVDVFEALIIEAAVHGYKIDPTDFMITEIRLILLTVKYVDKLSWHKRLQNSLSCLQKESISKDIIVNL